MTITDADRDAAALICGRGCLNKPVAEIIAHAREQAVQEAVAGIVAWLREQDGHGEWREAADAIDAEFLARTGGES